MKWRLIRTKPKKVIGITIPMVLLIILGVLAVTPAHAEDTFVLNTTISVPLSNKEKTGVTDLQLKEIFKRAGMKVEIKHLPAERALINADNGIDDGTFLRISGLRKQYSNLIKVPESFMNFEFVAITKKADIKIENWNSLSNYKLGIIIGWKIVEENTKRMKLVSKVPNVKQLFRLLEHGRVEVIIYEKIRALVELSNRPIVGATILEPALVSKPMFLYLNSKHERHISKLVAALQASKADKSHHRLMSEALKPYFKTE